LDCNILQTFINEARLDGPPRESAHERPLRTPSTCI
jgi:hypothetical protein